MVVTAVELNGKWSKWGRPRQEPIQSNAAVLHLVFANAPCRRLDLHTTTTTTTQLMLEHPKESLGFGTGPAATEETAFRRMMHTIGLQVVLPETGQCEARNRACGIKWFNAARPFTNQLAEFEASLAENGHILCV